MLGLNALTHYSITPVLQSLERFDRDGGPIASASVIVNILQMGAM